MQTKLNIGVTGSTGFVGERFLEYNRSGYDLRELNLRKLPVSEINLEGLDAIVHFAGLAHQMTPVADEQYYRINVDLTRELAKKAKESGIRHFIYISSTKVYGDQVNGILDENSPCNPGDAYGKSKCKAEEIITSMASEQFIVSIVRPPVVYGPKVKGNILKLMHLSNKKIPLPFGNLNNQRSMVFIDNLIELINAIIKKKAPGVFVAGDIRPVSTELLVSSLQKNMHGRTFLFSLPLIAKKLVKTIKPRLYTRLFGSFVIDNSSSNQRLDFVPPYQTEAGITEMVNWFKQQQNSN
jgi:nucleoside-diphosphate-sugar epimerase